MLSPRVSPPPDLSAQPHALDAPKGFNALTAHGDAERFAAPFGKLGAPLALEEHGLVLKPYPSCGYTHRLVDCALAMRERRRAGAEEIRAITLAIPDFHAAILPFGMPTDVREARFSLPFCTSLAYLAGAVTAEDFRAERWRAPEIAALIDRVEVAPFAPRRPELNYDPDEPDRMRMTFADGAEIETAVAYPLGAPQRPMSSEDVTAKFLQNAGDPPSADALDRLLDWPDAADIRPPIQLWSDPR